MNFLSPINFKVILDKIPNFGDYCQEASLPGMNLGVASRTTPFVQIPLEGNIKYTPFSLTFKIDEEMSNYTSIYHWMRNLGNPKDYTNYSPEKSDCSVIILNSSKKAFKEFKFFDCFPISMTPVNLDTTLTGIQYVTMEVVFEYLRYDVLEINP